MAGKPGQVQKRARMTTCRQKMWQTMRIMRGFSAADLMRTAGARLSNATKYLNALARHGFIRPLPFTGGRTGAYKQYVLVKNPGPRHPVCCEVCGRNLVDNCDMSPNGGHINREAGHDQG